MSVKVHELKTLPGPFQEVWCGLKPFEVRLDDRNYAVGEVLHLREWHPHTDSTGREIDHIQILSKLAGGQFGIERGYCVLGLECTGASRRAGE